MLLVLQRHQQLVGTAAERCNALDGASLVWKRHHRAVAINRMTGARKIPLAAFMPDCLRLLGEVRVRLGIGRVEKLNL